MRARNGTRQAQRPANAVILTGAGDAPGQIVRTPTTHRNDAAAVSNSATVDSIAHNRLMMRILLALAALVVFSFPAQVMARPQIREAIDKQGFALAASTPDELRTFTRNQLDAWARGFKEAGINPE
jgi:hypothetical protein